MGKRFKVRAGIEDGVDVLILQIWIEPIVGSAGYWRDATIHDISVL